MENPLVRDFASFIHTTASHTEDSPHLRIVFLLDETITDAKDWANCLAGLGVVMDSDKAIKDGGRMFYGNSRAEVIDLGGTMPKAEADRLITLGGDQRTLNRLRMKSDRNAAVQANTRLPRDIEVMVRTGGMFPLVDLPALTPIHCPVHADRNPSATVVESRQGSKGVWCSSCQMTFWPEAATPYNFDAFDNLVQERLRAHDAQTIADQTDPNPLKSFLSFFPPSPPIHEYQQKYLPPLSYEPGITLVKSPKGSGKTAAIAALIEQIREKRFSSSLSRDEKSNSVLLIGHRRLLIREAALRLGIDCYLGPPIADEAQAPDEEAGPEIDDEEIDDGDAQEFVELDDLIAMPDPVHPQYPIIPRNYVARQSEHIDHKQMRFGYAICLDSLPKLAGGPKYQTVIIDECEQVISHLLSETIQKSQSITQVFAALHWVLENARSIYVLDADLGLISLHALKVLRPGMWEDKLRIIYNRPLEVAQRRTINLYAARGDIITRLKDAVRDGKRCFVACNSRMMVKRIARLLRDEFGDGLEMMAIDSDNSQAVDEARFIQNIQRDILTKQVVVASPSLGTGIDISFPGGSCMIDEVFGLFSPYVNKHTDIDQQLARVRNPGNVSVWFGGGFTSFETNTDVVRDQLARANYVPHAIKPFIDPRSGKITYDAEDPLLNVVTHVRVAQWSSQNDIRQLFEKLRMENGWDFNRIKADNRNDGEKSYYDAVDAVEKDRIQQVLTARELSDQEYEELSKRRRYGKQVRGDNRHALERAMIERMWQAPVTEEMIIDFEEGKVIDAIRAYSWVFVPVHGDDTLLLAHQQAFDPNDPLLPSGGKEDPPHFLAMKLIFTTPLIEDGKLVLDRQVTKLDFTRFIEVAQNNKVVLQAAFGSGLRKDIEENPVKAFNGYIRIFGFQLKRSTRVTVGGVKLQSYKIDDKAVDRMETLSKLFKDNQFNIYPWLDRYR